MDWNDIEEEELNKLKNEAEELVPLNPSNLTNNLNVNCCRCPISSLDDISESNGKNILSSIYHILDTLDFQKPVQCISNEIINSMNLLTKLSSYQEMHEGIIASCDLFLRQRHEVLHSLSLMSLSKDAAKSDHKFSDLFEINSDRTPDYIEILGKNVNIMETTVTTDMGKSYMLKGKEDQGYQSKYQSEINRLKEMGFRVVYTVVVYNARDMTDMSYKTDIENMATIFGYHLSEENLAKLEFVRRIFCRVQNLFGKKLSKFFSLLFRQEYVPNRRPSKIIDYVFTDKTVDRPNYIVATTSVSLYTRIVNSWQRISRLVGDLENGKRYILNVDISKNKYSFALSGNNNTGLSSEEWVECMIRHDKASLILNMQTTVDGTIVKDETKSVELILPGKSLVTNQSENIDLEIHDSSLIAVYTQNIPDYKDKLMHNEFLLKGSRFEDPEYEDKIERMLSDYLERKRGVEEIEPKDFPNKVPFASNVLRHDTFNKAIQSYFIKYKEKNDFDNDPKNILHQKPSFMYPLVNMTSTKYCHYNDKPVELINGILSADVGEFTKIILKKSLDNNYVFGSKPNEIPKDVLDVEQKISEHQKIMHKYQFSHKGIDGNVPKLRDIEGGPSLIDEYKRLTRDLKKVSNKLGYRRKAIGVIRLATKNKNRNSTLGNLFSKEMSHFREKKSSSIYKGVGRFNCDILNSEFQHTKRVLIGPSGHECPDRIYDDHVADDVTLLKQLKADTLSNVREMMGIMRSTNLYHSLAMMTRFCYSLMYFSQTSIGSDYVFLDNLGCESTLLICKGGKKMFRTKKSKLYRVAFKVYSSTINDYCRPGYNSTYTHFKIDSEDFVISPWMCMEETLMSDGLTMLSRCMGYCLMNVTKRESTINTLSDCYFNIMLAVHARRKTEAMLHSMRYIVVNSMSEISCVEKMLKELADFNHDFFQAFIREKLLSNYTEHCMKLKKFHDDFKGGDPDQHLLSLSLKHLYDDSVNIDTMEALTLTIYCTFLMTKAPITQAIEQVHNLNNMLITHKMHKDVRSDDFIEQYENSTTTVDESDTLEEYWGKLFENDFVYDPKYVTLLGNMCSDYLLSRKNASEMDSKWQSIINEPWDCMANTSGLRGDKDKNFFGKKGYFIVYNEILKDPGYLNDVIDILDSGIDDFNKRKNINRMNQTFANKIMSKELDEVIFHVVDKKQRGGSREIFVMDYKTKLNQQPIEKFCAYLCKQIPNELISIPSNRRLFHIHSNVFEKFLSRGGIQYNLVLDCRRWAPHSVINKFIDFLIGMRNCLPKGFLIHCLNFFELMFNKKVYTRKYVYDILEGNRAVPREFISYLTEDAEVNGYYLEMSYSWMMGIFNYLSSLLHVMNQMHASQMLMRVNNNVYSTDFEMHLNAHSDDSGGKMVCQTPSVMKKSFTCYELLLKSCNHMLSDKKCNISKTYLELLSILYIGGRLLSLLNKFTGSFNFHPTDRGYSMDIMESYSKSTELLLNGATFDQAYLALKIMSYLIWRFYFGNEVNKISYELPPQLMGMPDAHPLNILISGGDSDVIRLYLRGKEKEGLTNLKRFVYISKHFSPQDLLSDSFIAPVCCEPQIIMSKDLLELTKLTANVDEDLKWFVKNVSQNNTSLMLIRYLENIKQKNFCAALQDETLSRRISRAYYFRSSRSVIISSGHCTLAEARTMIEMMFKSSESDFKEGEWGDVMKLVKENMDDFLSGFDDVEDQFEILHSEVLLLNKSLNSISFKKENLVLSRKTCKPVHINIQRVNTPLTQDFKPDFLTAWVCFPNLRWILPPSGYQSQIQMLQEFLNFRGKDIPTNNPSWLYKLLNKYKGKYIKELYMHSNMPSGARDINNYKDLLQFLAHNSFPDRYIEGIISPFNRTMGVPIEQLFTDFFDTELMNLTNLMNLVSGVFNNLKLKDALLSLKINGFSGDIMDYLKHKSVEMSEKYQVVDILTPHIKSLVNSGFEGLINDLSHLRSSYFHCFVKRQHLVGNVWLGKGKVYISVPSAELIFDIENLKVTGVTSSNSNFVLSKYELTYIDYVLQSGQLPNLKSSMEAVAPHDWMKKKFGINDKGVFGIYTGRELLYYMPKTRFTRVVHNVLSNIDLCQAKIMPKMRYKIFSTDNFGNRDEIVIHTFDLPNIKLLEICHDLFHNHENIITANNLGRELKDFIVDIVGESTQSERYINPKHLANSYTVSRIYSIIKSLLRSQAISIKDIALRDQIYPGQEGGFLDLLIKYKGIKPDFPFKHDRVLTPELMYLKSTQPEVFISNLVTNIKTKYYSLYDGKDRRVIMSQLAKVLRLMGTDDAEGDLTKLLLNWSFIGVMGALEDIRMDKIPDSFKFFKLDPENSVVVKFSKKILNNIMRAILDAYKDCDLQNYITDKFYKLPKNISQMKMFLIGFVHSNVLTIYDSRSNFNNYILSTHCIILNDLLRQLFSNDLFLVSFYSKLEEHPILANIPVGVEYVNDWCQALNVVLNNAIKTYEKDKQLNNNLLIQRDIVPLNETQDLINESITFNVRRLHHNGTMPKEFYWDRRGRHTVINNNKYYTFDFIPADKLSKRLIPLNSHYIFDTPIKNDVDDIDEEFDDYFFDIVIELKSSEPDVDMIMDMCKKEWFEEKYKRDLFLSTKDGLRRSTLIKVNFVNIVGQYSNPRTLQRILNLGETIVIAADFIIKELCLSDNPKIKIFKPHIKGWADHSLIDPQLIFYYVKDSVDVDEKIWSKYLEADQVDRKDLSILVSGVPHGNYYDPQGVLIENNLFSTDASKSLEAVMDSYDLATKSVDEADDEDAGIDQDKKIDEEIHGARKILKDLEDKGYSKPTILKYEKQLDVLSHGDNYGDLSNRVKRIMSSAVKETKVISDFKMSVTDLIKNKNEKEFINRVFEIPGVFAVGTPSNSNIMNQSLKDGLLRAEIECFGKGFTDKILSSQLNISARKMKFLKGQFKMYRAYTKISKHNELNKNFMLDVAILLLNDARVLKDADCDNLWDNMNEVLSEYITLTDEDSDSDSSDVTYEVEEDTGYLNYGII
jgi:hypothetical protein